MFSRSFSSECRFLFILAMAFGSQTTFVVSWAEAKQPNLIVMIADDQRADALSCVGHPFLKTPNIDRLATEGVMFNNAFVTTSICCTTRADFLSGNYSRRHGILTFNQKMKPVVLAATYPAVLKKAGYRVGMIGKWGIGLPPAGTFDYWQAWTGQGSFFHDVDGKRVHNSMRLAMWAEEFLSVKDDRPFCLVVCYKSPHEPFQPDPELGDLFPGVKFPPPKTYSEKHFKQIPEFSQKSEGRTRLMKRHPTPESYQQFVRNYLGCVASIDRSVGKIRSVLDREKLTDNTVMVYTSDHGFLLGEHGLSGKWLMYEESIRIPLIVRDGRQPKQLQGKRLDEMVLSIDLASTLLELAGVKNAPEMDGRSLLPVINGKTPNDWRQDYFYEHHFAFRGRIPHTEGIRGQQWKYTVYYPYDSFDLEHPLHEELFDLAADPLEEHNLAGEKRHAGRLAELRKRYRLQAKLHSSAIGKK